MHRVLERQLKRFLGTLELEKIPAEWMTFLQAVSDTYSHSDEDRTLVLRSLELSSGEFAELNKKLESENEIIEQKVKDRTLELEYERTKLNEVAQRMATGAILLSGAGEVSFVNAPVVRLLNVTETGRTIEVFAQGFSSIPAREYIEKSLKGESTDISEVEALGKIFSVSFVSLKGKSEVFGALIWLNDITEQKLLERSKDQFLAITSHEMRTPLAVIRGNAELLLEENATSQSPDTKKEIESIVRNAVRLLGIVNDFMDLQNLETKKVFLTLESVDIVNVLEETIADLSELAAKKNIFLTLKKPSAVILPLNLDKSRLQQIYVNLIGNAVHYTEKGGITVSAEKQNDAVRIVFQDTGIGIDLEDQNRLFKKFATGKEFLHSKEYGSGLGLYISRLLTNLMGGVLRLERSEVGTGSVFSLTFPLTLQSAPQK